jgi:hypothetical protein
MKLNNNNKLLTAIFVVTGFLSIDAFAQDETLTTKTLIE